VDTLQLPPSPPGGPPLSHAWQTLADGLMTQRIHLHLEEWRALVAEDAELPDIAAGDLALLSQRPQPLSTAGSSAVIELLEAASLSYWWQIPMRYGTRPQTGASTLRQAAVEAAQATVGQHSGTEWGEAVTAVSGAAAWWVGFFGVIRHRGVHHITLEPHPGRIHAKALASTVGVVAHGMAARVLEAAMQARDDRALRAAYCRVIECSIEAERQLPTLIEELAELRLVDLVTTTSRWRGRFTKYAGGTGAGQVE
jgi:hypothetical protein